MTMSCNDDHPAFKTDWDRAHEQHQQPLPALVPKYERMRQALAEVVRVDEAKDIADQASALRAYARMRHDHEAELLMVEIKLRAYRRIGELSAELEKSNGGRGKTLPAAGKSFKKDTLAKSGISTSAAQRAEQIAKIPQAAFDSYLDEKRVERQPVTIQEMLVSVTKRRKTDHSVPVQEWFESLQLAGADFDLKPGPLLRLFKQTRTLSETQRFMLILGLLNDPDMCVSGFVGSKNTGSVDQVERWYWKLLARLIDIDGVESALRRLVQQPPGAAQEHCLKQLMRGEDELFLAIDPRDDLAPLCPRRRRRREKQATDSRPHVRKSVRAS